MLYIITEDKNSARDFWEAAASVYRDSGTYTLVPLLNNDGGNTTLWNQVVCLAKALRRGDELFIVLDNVSATKTFNPYDLLYNTSQLCKRIGVRFSHTKYYCFEEVILSYDYIIELSKTKYKDVLEYVNKCINSNTEYFNILNMHKTVSDFILNSGHRIPNKEHFANELLIEVTKSIYGHFKITKRRGSLSSSGECWINSCHNIRKNMGEHQIFSMCSKCEYRCKDCDIKYKIKHIEEHSLFKDKK